MSTRTTETSVSGKKTKNKTFAPLTFFFPTELSPLTDQRYAHELGYFISSVILFIFYYARARKRIYLCASREEFEALLSSFLHFFHFFLFLHFRQITHISLFTFVLYYARGVYLCIFN